MSSYIIQLWFSWIGDQKPTSWHYTWTLRLKEIILFGQECFFNSHIWLVQNGSQPFFIILANALLLYISFLKVDDMFVFFFFNSYLINRFWKSLRCHVTLSCSWSNQRRRSDSFINWLLIQHPFNLIGTRSI